MADNTTTSAEAVNFLKQLRPNGPWLLVTIDPVTEAIKAITTCEPDMVRKFIDKHNGKRNLYFSVNPPREGMTKKPRKSDLSQIEFEFADLDPKDTESPEAAKVRYRAALESYSLTPTAVIDSGNGIQALWRLDKPIELEPMRTKNKNGRTSWEFPPETKATIADVEARAKYLMETLGSVAGTENIDRILRLPGTINLPNAAKIKQGRVACPASLIKFNGESYPFESFPKPPNTEAKTKTDGSADKDKLFEEFGESISPSNVLWRELNETALANLEKWVPDLFPDLDLKQRGDGGYRITSEQLKRDLEEDLAITPDGIKDFGVHDLKTDLGPDGIDREGKRTPIDLVIEYGYTDFNDAAAWLRERLGLETDPGGSDVPPDAATSKAKGKGAVRLEHFVAYMPMHTYIFAPTREPWPASSVDARIPPQPLYGPDGKPKLDGKGKPVVMLASRWIDKRQPVEQMTWAPGLPMKIKDRLVAEGGWIEHKGVTTFNLYRPPAIIPGDPNDVKPWLDHLHKIYPDDAEHILNWLAHRVQKPHDKINHGLVLGGLQGIGKDTTLEPVKRGVGPWNFQEISPTALTGRFNGFLKAVILRVNEARDLGEVNRFSFYEHLKPMLAAPPDVLRVDEKNLREHSVFNVCGVIITTNYKTDGIYLPADDRRHYVAWSDSKKEDFSEQYWNEIWSWYNNGGDRNVVAYLKARDLSSFDPKAPPPKTEAFWAIVNSNRPQEEGELADVFDAMKNPNAVTIEQIAKTAASGTYGDLYAWIDDRKNRRAIPHRLETSGYVPVRNTASAQGLWMAGGKRQVIYAKSELSINQQIEAATELQDQLKPKGKGNAKPKEEVWDKPLPKGE